MRKIRNILINVVPIFLVIISFSCLLFFPSKQNGKSIYLSDISPLSTNLSTGELMIDKNSVGEPISLIIDGEKVTFDKGIGVNASSTIVYDLSNYTKDYTRIYGYLGVDAVVEDNGDGVKFAIYASTDNANWDLILNSNLKKGSSEAEMFDIDISNYKFIKLYASRNGTSDYDYAVYADLRLLSDDYNLSYENYNEILTIEEYDKELSLNKVDYNMKYRKSTILRREFVSRYGYQTIQNAIRRSGDIKEMIDWLINDNDSLSLLLECGYFYEESSRNALNALAELYKTHKDDFELRDGTIYKKMMFATALAYSKQIKSFASQYSGSNALSSPLARYESMKYLYDSLKFNDKEQFKNLSPELIRMVMDAKIEDDEIIWLNLYANLLYNTNTIKKLDGSSYIENKIPNLLLSDYYNLDNKDFYNNKYRLDLYNSSIINSFSEEERIRLWMLIESGCTSWGISGLSVALNEVFGIPASRLYQTGNDAYIVYSETEEGLGRFVLLNSTSNWYDTSSKNTSNSLYSTHMLLNWGLKEYNNPSTNGSYLVLAMDALNDYDNFCISNLYNWLANSYSDFDHKLECYRYALSYSNINLDTYDSLYDLYSSNYQTTDTDWYSFAEQIINAYTYYPLAMHEELTRIKPHLFDDTLRVSLDILECEALNKALVSTSKESINYNVTRNIAQGLLSSKDFNLATFSFDGVSGGRIVLNSVYDDLIVTVMYSLDGGKTFKDTVLHSVFLTNDELSSINSKDDIIVTLLGSLAEFRIDILDGDAIQQSKTIQNDQENSFVGDIDLIEYSTDGGVTFNSYVSGIRFSGDVDVIIRTKAHDNYLHGPSQSYTFTTDTDTPEQKYLYVEEISVIDYSSAQTGRGAELSIDANSQTSWHTTFNTIDEERYIVFQLKDAKYISKITYQSANVNGRIRQASIYTSMDGITYEKVLTTDVFPNNTNVHTIQLPEIIECVYIKIVADHTYGNTQGEYDKYFSVSEFSFYYDSTK